MAYCIPNKLYGDHWSVFLEKEFDMEIPNFVMVLLVIGAIGGFAMAEGKSFWTSGTPH